MTRGLAGKTKEMAKQYVVYILACPNNRAIYIGSTSRLEGRMLDHRTGTFVNACTRKYGIRKLVYYQVFETYEQAAVREQQLKRWKRSYKNELIAQFNPMWDDLAPHLE